MATVDITNNAIVNVPSNSPNDKTNDIRTVIHSVRDAGGGTIIFPSGVYHVTGNIFDGTEVSGNNKSNITIQGEGPGGTIIRLHSSTPGTTPIILKTVGNTSQAAYFTMRDITLDGNNVSGGALWFRFEKTSFVRLERMSIINTLSGVIYGRQWWDSVIHDVHFENVGTSSNVAAVLLDNDASPPTQFASSNNLKFEVCRWIDCGSMAVKMREFARMIYFTGCYFQGKETSGYSNIHIEPTTSSYACYLISFNGCRFIEGGLHHIYAKWTHGVLVTGCGFEGKLGASNNAGYAIELDNTSNSVITGNNFATGANPTPVTNGLGPYHTTGTTTGNVVKANVGLADI